MTKKDEKELLKNCVKAWGVNSQLDMMVEECAELIQAINKYKRKQTFESIANIEEELVDVHIMLQQTAIIFLIPDKKLSDIRNKKLKRVSELLNNHYKNLK